MTDRVEVSLDKTSSSRQLAASIYRGGGNWVVPGSDDPGNIATDNADIDDTSLDGFTQSNSSNSFDVTINPGQGYVGGTWLARDTSTTVTLASGTDDQDVYVGVDRDSKNGIIVGLDSAFGAGDPKTILHRYNTNSNGVTNHIDKRQTIEPGGNSALVFGGY